MPQRSGKISGGGPGEPFVRPKTPKKLTYESTGSLRGRGANGYSPDTRVYAKLPTSPIMPTTPLVGNGGLGDYYAHSAAGSQGAADLLSQLFAQVNAGGASGGQTGYVAGNGGGTGGATDTGGGGNAGGNTGNVGGTGSGGTTPSTDYQSYGDRFGGTGTDFASQQSAYANATGYVNNQDAMAADLLASHGITNPDMIKQITDLIGPGYVLQLFAQGSPNGQDQTQFVADYINQMFTPGGRIPTFDELTNMLMSDPSSMGSSYLNSGTSSNVNDVVMNLLSSITGNPYYLNAMNRDLKNTDLNYRRDQIQTGGAAAPTSYADYLFGQGIPGMSR